MGRQSSVKKLEPEVRDYLEKLLREDRYTLDELVYWVRQKFPDKATPSRSSLGRYRMSFEEMSGRMREMQAASRVLVSELGEDVDDKLGGLLVQAVTAVAAHTAMSLHDGDAETPVSIEDVGQLARAARAVMATRGLSLKERQELRRLAREELIREQKAKLDELGQSGAVAPEVLAKVIAAAYGL